MKKYVILALAILMLASMLMVPISRATAPGVIPGTANNPDYGTFKVDEGAGAFPSTLDPANCYDTASAEVIFNSMETVTYFLGEHYDLLEPMLATQVTVLPPSTTPDMHTGLTAPPYTNATVDFKIRTGVPFQNGSRTDVTPAPTWGQFYLTTDDVGYTFQRFLVHDYVGAATWMWFEPLLDCDATPLAGKPAPYDLANWGTKIQNAVQWNATDVWINLCNPKLTPATGSVSFAPVKMFDNDFGNGTFRADPATGFYAQCAALPMDFPIRILVQVVSQQWLSIMSKQWVLTYVNSFPAVSGTPPASDGNPADWNGSFSVGGQPMYWYDYNGWSATQSPEDHLTSAATPGLMCGTGPYILDRYDSGTGWSSVLYDAYWQGWWWPGATWSPLWPFWWIPLPPTWPVIPGLWPPYWPWPIPPVNSCPYPPLASNNIPRGGYIKRLTIDNTKGSTARITDLKAGDVDMAAVSRIYANRLHVADPGNPLGDRFNGTVAGVSLNFPIPTLQVESEHYTFIVNPTPGDLYGKIMANNTLDANGIPANFLNNSDVRMAMTWLQNFTYAIQTLFYGEAYQPRTCAPDGLPYVNPALPQYPNQPQLAAAKALLETVSFGPNANQKLTNVGCDIPICYYDSVGGVREAYCINFADEINKVGALTGGGVVKAHIVYLAWNDFIPAIDASECATFRVGWLADYADIHDFLFPYADSKGTYGHGQRMNDPLLDSLIEGAERVADGPLRQALYYQAEQELYNLNSQTYIMIPIGRGYMRTWVNGMQELYNPLYPGFYARYLWKWTYIRGDIDYSGSVTMGDIVKVLNAFGSYAGFGGMPVYHPRWEYHADIDGNPYESYPSGDGGWKDRRINMWDVSQALNHFGKTANTWQNLVPYPHDLQASLNAPTFMNVTLPNPPSTTITYLVKNIGTSGEINVVLTLDIENATKNPGGVNAAVSIVITQNIPALASGATASFTYTWTPLTPALGKTDDYTFDNYATPVPGETVVINNDVTGYCTVSR